MRKPGNQEKPFLAFGFLIKFKGFVSWCLRGNFSRMMKRSFIFGLVLLVLLLNLALGANVYLRAAKTSNDSDNAQASEELFEDALQKIHSEYVDGKDLTYRQLVYSALKGAVSKLDPHSEFLDADSFQELQDDTEGQFGGLGLVVAMKDGFVTVVAPMEDTPGFRAGILTGDRIVRVEGKSVDKLPLPRSEDNT